MMSEVSPNSNSNNAANAPEHIKCANPECEKESGKLICPKCKDTKMPLKVSSFCSQDCFKTFWPIHKLTHELPKTLKAQKKTTTA